MILSHLIVNVKHDPGATHPGCRLNYFGSKGMEAAAAVELDVNSQNLKDANVEVGIFIADNDSSCIAAIQKESTLLL